MLSFALSAVCLITVTGNTYAQNRMDEMWGEQKEKNHVQTSVRDELFDKGNYAMFVHWGLYSHPMSTRPSPPSSILSTSTLTR